MAALFNDATRVGSMRRIRELEAQAELASWLGAPIAIVNAATSNAA